jgi:hypothetical protein
MRIGREEIERELIEFAQTYQGHGHGETPLRPFAEFGIELDHVMSEGARFARTRIDQGGYFDTERWHREMAVCFTIGLGAGLRLGRTAVRRGIT